MIWKKWLMAGWWATAAMGASMVLGACIPGSEEMLSAALAPLFLGADPGAGTAALRLMWGIGGGVCLGWAVMGALLTRNAWGEPWAWWAIVLSAEVWLLSDSVASYLSGGVLNVVVNTVFFVAAFGVPLWATRPAALLRRPLRS